MAKKNWYRWTWADGTITIAMGYDRTEMAANVRKYGKLISKVFDHSF